MSSDSEDDWYGNVTERLQKMKDQFNQKQTESVNLYDDSGELDEIVKKCVLPPKGKRKSGNKSAKDTPDCSVSDISNISIDNVLNNASKRVTRSSTRNSGVNVSDNVSLPPPRSRTQRDTSATSESSSTSRGRGGRGRGRGKSPRGRGRSRGRRNRAMITDFVQAFTSSSLDPSIPIYSIGNTADYPDQLHNQPLFNNQQKNDDVVLVGEDDSFDNEELSVKVYWQSSEIFKFSIRKYQKLTQIFDYFAKKENIDKDKLLFTYQEKILKSDDTPDSIDYSIVKFIEGGIVTQGVSDLVTMDRRKIKDGIKLKFQCQNVKKPHEVTIRPNENLSSAMMQYSEHIEIPIDRLKFEFDGNSISGKLTPEELELEGDECIDVRIIS
ncbi:uncharacterized protein LOC126378456 [Pectinophora gossypiella]|uniref:uncharacterized protein LOC126378456 n=1 Tax=Pectinophora gossypiella TaxID=13191 RepID=UPI00214E9A2C|nr:uncharacterized protein LOC126378456 [Pectinophora gossypiella]